jgi:hypothetical protein
MAAQMSIQDMMVPPKAVPRALACCGNTNSVISVKDNHGDRGLMKGSMAGAWYLDRTLISYGHICVGPGDFNIRGHGHSITSGS